MTTYLVAHELGHSFGLGHSNLTDCKHHGCGALEYGDPYDTMGVGSGDFSAKAKFDLGWLTNVARPAKDGTYDLAPIERTSRLAQAFGPVLAGVAIGAAAFGLPFYAGGGLKILYDLALFGAFRNRPAEHES